ncbi:FtsK/SpoIIIE domain-containing protein [Angustibacter luteus]|uniref:FtsK/SpoIIIE domain-containing protein n=1 Tax=Angustibacter luteus TaxID=658456 RepID=A0ABW1JJ79_9ACTN
MNPLRCTVIDARSPASALDVDVRAPAGTLLGEVSGALLGQVGAGADSALTIRGRRLPPDLALGTPPLVEGVLLVAVPAGAATERRAGERTAGVLELCVVAGPDAGRRIPLQPGPHTIGRGGAADLQLADPSVSRLHLRIRVDPGGTVVHDLGSSNGSLLDGEPVGPTGRQVRPGQRIRVGESTLVVRVTGSAPASLRGDGNGGIEVNRAPRTDLTVEPTRISRPAAPTPPAPTRIPWIAVALPLLLCVPMALLLHQPTYLAFGLLGPVAMLSTTVAERLGRGRRHRSEQAAWKVRDDAADQARLAALRDELERRRALAGDAAELSETVHQPTARLWQRGPGDDDLLSVVLGARRCRSSVRVGTGQVSGEADGELQWLDDAPATLPLDRAQHLGLAGDEARVTALGRYLVGQLAGRCSPRGVRLAVIGPATTWSWARWLPHRFAGSLVDLEHEVQRRIERADGRSTRRPAGQPRGAEAAIVVLLDLRATARGAAGGNPVGQDPALATVLRHGPAVGVHTICLAGSASELPSECGLSITLPSSGPASTRGLGGLGTDGADNAHGADGDGAGWDLAPDGVGAAWADELARALAPFREATPEPAGGDSLPVSVALTSLLDVDAADPAALADSWRRSPRSTTVTLGAGRDGRVCVDLLADGPHTLVAGTTGAGKSELLLTLVTSLALGNRPDELSFVLVDYKGGAAFRRCADLPHVLGVVSDLDGHLAARALTALQAELTRRERLLAEVGAADLGAYQRWCDDEPGRPALARLVLVIDEFRLLAGELPDFLDGLVRLAAVGRSLGVHLVLATQRPAGIVTADIKANVNLRICLRVRDRVDSEDVLDAADAAVLPDGVPGRGLFRAGSKSLTAFQTALAGGTAHGPRISRPLVLPAGHPVPVDPHADELAALVRSMRAASALVGAEPPPSPWLPPLPEQLASADLRGAAAGGAPAWGLADLPVEGRQEPFGWDPLVDSHLAISGAPRTGRTNALLALATALLASPEGHHVHVVDAAGGALARALDPGARPSLPQLGTVLTGEPATVVARLVDRLSSQLNDRRGPGTERPGRATVLLVDGWESLAEGLERVDHGRGLDALLSLVRDGERAGLRLVVAGGRAVLTSRIGSLVGQRLLLRPTDPTDLLLAGVPTSAVPSRLPAGRVIHLPGGRQVQLVRADGEQLRATLAASPTAASGLAERALRLRRLPDLLHLTELDAWDGAGVLLGVGGDEALPVAVDPAVHRRWVVLGPAGSGRSQVLAVVARQLHARGRRVIALAPLGGPLHEGGWPTATDGPELLRLLMARPADPVAGACVLVDDAERVAHDPAVAGALEQLARDPGPHCLALALRTEAGHLPVSAPFVAAALRQRTGVLLGPHSPHDGDPFGVRVEPVESAAPGRGVLVLRGATTAVQVAL